jgi:hypothetical protein
MGSWREVGRPSDQPLEHDMMGIWRVDGFQPVRAAGEQTGVSESIQTSKM